MSLIKLRKIRKNIALLETEEMKIRGSSQVLYETQIIKEIINFSESYNKEIQPSRVRQITVNWIPLSDLQKHLSKIFEIKINIPYILSILNKMYGELKLNNYYKNFKLIRSIRFSNSREMAYFIKDEFINVWKIIYPSIHE